MEGEFQTLLLSQVTPWRRAVEQTSGERWDDLDVDIIRRSKDPWTCPEHLLNFLAFERSVDIWDETWSIEKKRAVIASAPADHRLKGTLAGSQRYLQIAGAEFRRVIRPPDKTFLSGSLTAQERAEFLARFPQIRIYPYIRASQQQHRTFTTASGRRRKHFVGLGYPYDSSTGDRYRREAKLYEPRDGSLTELTHREVKRIDVSGKAVDVQEIILAATKSGAIYLDQKPKNHLYFGPTGIAKRIVTITTPRGYGYTIGQSQYHTVPVSFDPVDVKPDLVADTGVRAVGARFPRPHGRSFVGAYLPPSTAWHRIYERIYLHDAERLPDLRPRTTHVGYTRLGHALFTAKITARVRGRRPTLAVGRFVFGHLVAGDRRPLNMALSALASSKAMRDRVLLNPTTRRTPRVGDRMKVGSLRLGATISS